jgi:uncharacterized membrane protein
MRHKVHQFLSDRRGSIAVTTALIFTVLLGFTALGVDVANMFADRRKAQSTADLAAIAAVSDLVNASRAATDTVARNGYLNNASFNLEYGVYSPDINITPGNRFKVADVASANAARITLTTITPLFFSGVITGKDSFVIKTLRLRRARPSPHSRLAPGLLRWMAACSIRSSAECWEQLSRCLQWTIDR